MILAEMRSGYRSAFISEEGPSWFSHPWEERQSLLWRTLAPKEGDQYGLQLVRRASFVPAIRFFTGRVVRLHVARANTESQQRHQMEGSGSALPGTVWLIYYSVAIIRKVF